MRTSKTKTARAAAAAWLLSWSEVNAAIVEAGTLTSVTVEAPLYDTDTSAAKGCSPAGCVGDLTRDGDLTSTGSRWSCKPALGAAGSACSITYTLAESLAIDGLRVAMYKGDSRTRTMGIYVDGALSTTWTSSGTTAGFESIDVGVAGQTVELRGTGADSEWLSVMEVEVMVDDGNDPAVVEAGTLGTVTTSATWFDERTLSAGGCDPAGCTADLTRDGDMAPGSRWSCSPKLGGPCTISYDLGATRDLSELRIAMYKGATRTTTAEVYVDGALVTTWTSSGTTSEFETIDLSGSTGTVVEITGVLGNSEWLSIVETEIMVLTDNSGVQPTPSPSAPTTTPTPTASSPVEAGTLGTVSTSTTFYDTDASATKGCPPAGCTAALTRDNDLTETSRWSCSPKLGGSCDVSYDLGVARDLSELRLAMYKGTTRTKTIDVYVDDTLVTTWTSSGTTDGFETIDMSGTSGTVIKLSGVLGSSEWISITETEIMVSSGGSPPPSPTPTPTPTTPTGDLKPVGLIPLALGDGTDKERFTVKDGDFSTSWTCTGDPREPDSYYLSGDCTVSFRLIAYRHIKQVKIALPDGAERTIDMRIAGRWNSDLLEEFVTSSGTTDEFETYDLDFHTNFLQISGVFTTNGQSISISEVELVEELSADEVQLSAFNTPYDNGDGLWTVPTTAGFAWSSDSDEAIDRTLNFIFSSFASVTAIDVQFPVGDTYKFDLIIYDDRLDEPLYTITDFESEDTAGWQSFDLSRFLNEAQYVTSISLVIKGTGSGAPGFKMLDARIVGTPVDNPTDEYFVGSTFIEYWEGSRYADFVAEGSGDQKAIMGAICAVKKASFDGVDCIGEDPTATGTVTLPMGGFYVDGNIFMKSGVRIDGRYSIDDGPHTTDILLEEDAAGKTSIGPIIVADGISDAGIRDLWIRGLYDPETSNGSPAVDGLGSTCLSITNSQNITCKDTEIRFCDGDGLVISDSKMINIDAGRYDDEYLPWSIGFSRDTGLVVDASDSVWVRRHTMYDNGVAGIHITGSNNFTFEATIGSDETEGEGNVGRTAGQQPIEVIVESSSLVTFQDMRVSSDNDPAITISADSSQVAFNNCGFSSVPSGTCVIQAEDPTVVTAEDDELSLTGTCFVKV